MLRLRNCQVAILFRKLPHSACSKSLYAGEGIWRRDARIGLAAESSMNCQLANADSLAAVSPEVSPRSVHRCQVAITRY